MEGTAKPGLYNQNIDVNLTMPKPISALAKIPLFSQLSDQELAALSEGAVFRSFPKNRLLIEDGDISDSLYVIFSGQLQVYLSDDEGKEVVLNMMGPGEYFGELALLDDAPRSASVMVVEDCKLSIISRPVFEQIIESHTGIERALLRGLAKRLRSLTNNVRNLALMDIYGRIAHLLCELAEEKDGQFITGKLTHQDLANRVGSSREMVSRILKDLRMGGYISIENKKIIIHKTLPERW